MNLRKITARAMQIGASTARRARTHVRRSRNRTDLLNHLAELHQFETYLEIGVRDPRDNLDYVRVPHKNGVDPNPRRRITHTMTSDDFFSSAPQSYDLIFIDGLHLAEQAYRDITNALRILSPSGRIVVHDCNPLTEDAQTECYDGKKLWNGTVWKAWAKLRSTQPNLSMCVVDIDHGCGVIHHGNQDLYDLAPALGFSDMQFKMLASDRVALLNLISWRGFVRMNAHPRAGRN